MKRTIHYGKLPAALAVLIPVLLGCSGIDDDSPQAVTAPEEPALTQGVDLSLRTQVDIAKKDLAQRLNVEIEVVELSGARPVNWRSSALGCPEPGMQYTQALMPGALIFLRTDGVVHGYHAAYGKEPFYCPRDRAEQPVFGQGADQI